MGFAPIESPPTTSQYKFCAICHHLAEIPVSNYGTQFDPRLEVGVDQGVKHGTNRKVIPTLRLISIRITGLSCAAWPQYTARQIDRAIGIGCLCYGIGGVINTRKGRIITRKALKCRSAGQILGMVNFNANPLNSLHLQLL